jgi:hypothetical protein
MIVFVVLSYLNPRVMYVYNRIYTKHTINTRMQLQLTLDDSSNAYTLLADGVCVIRCSNKRIVEHYYELFSRADYEGNYRVEPLASIHIGGDSSSSSSNSSSEG